MSFARMLPLLGLAAAFTAHAQLRTYPASPQAGQEFVVQISQTGGCGPSSPVRGEVEGTVISLVYEEAGACFPTRPPEPPINVVVRVPVAGSYLVRERGEYQGRVSVAREHGQITVQAASTSARPPYSLAGLWNTASEPGWGVNIAEGDSGQLFITWFTYGRFISGTRALASWYVASSGRWTGPNEFSAPFYWTQGPVLGATFDPSRVVLMTIGQMTITVHSPDSITFSVEGHDGSPLVVTRTLNRFRF